MSIQEFIDINTYYTRSINLERDANNVETVKAYIPTSRSLQTLERISKTLNTDAIPRAWALTGPYGSGKSLFAVFLSHLLGNPEDELTQVAENILAVANPELSKIYQAVTNETQAFCVVLLTGSPAPLGRQFLKALSQSSQKFWGNKRGPTPKIVSKIKQVSEQDNYEISEILELVEELQDKLLKANSCGLLIVIDELGKFLEYEARHVHINDIFLLQALAEQAKQAHGTPLYLVVLLHQAFEQYAKGLGDRLKNEWKKVQGRFESIAFLESSEQIIRVVQKALVHRLDFSDYPDIKQHTDHIAQVLKNNDALPGTLEVAEASELFLRCYPLHPLTLLALPTLCQKVAQNERTLFSYLGSSEPYGFRESLSHLNIDNIEWILPWQLYEYFILNQPTSLSDPITQRRWAEIITAVERLGDVSDTHIHLLKTIGLLNLIGSQGNFKASPELIALCESDKSILENLIDKSVITYRKFNNEYRVWQGSDFDLEAAVQEEKNQLGRIDLADELNKTGLLLPLVARRHTYRTGTLRYFTPVFADILTLKKVLSPSNQPRLILFLTENEEDFFMFGNKCREQQNIDKNSLDVIGLFSKGEQLREITTEVLVLQRIQHTQKDLHNDPVAQHEYKIRLKAAEQILKSIVKDIIRLPQNVDWYWQGQTLLVKNAAGFQEKLSGLMDGIFSKTPIIKNELINRNKPSVSAITARNKLLASMLSHSHTEDLGINKYPPEKAIYRSLLKATGLHRPIDNIWQFADPPKNDPCNLQPTWRYIEHYLGKCNQRPCSFEKLFHKLEEAPYGITAGVSLILVVTAFLIYKDELALYEENIFVPMLSLDVIERFRMDTKRFSVQYFKLDGMRASMFREYVKLLAKTEIDSKPDILSIARPIAKFMGNLPGYTGQTKTVSQEAQAVRDAFYKAKSPNELLFEALPAACGYTDLAVNEQDIAKLEGFSSVLVKTLRELNTAHEKLLSTLQQHIKTAFDIDSKLPLTELRERLRGRYGELEDYTVDREGLKAFIKTLADKHGNEKQWLERLGAFLARTPTDRWTDDHIYNVSYKLVEFSRKLTDLEQLRVFYQQEKYADSPEFEATLLRSVRKGKNEQYTIAYVDKNIKDAVQVTIDKIAEHLEELTSNEHRKAVVAELVNTLLEAETSAKQGNDHD